MGHWNSLQRWGNPSLICLTCLVTLIGCSRPSAPPTVTPPLSTTVTSAAKPPAPVSITLKDASWEQAQELIAQHKGKIVVLDVWTTTCATCVEALPKFVALQQKYHDKDIVWITLNADYDGIDDKPPAVYREQVEIFLQNKQATSINLLATTPLLELLDESTGLFLPAWRIYGTDGQLVKQFDSNTATEETFPTAAEAQLVELLARPKT